jgi:hypothetical protein
LPLIMIFWCIILAVFAFLSYAIDSGALPYYIFRHLWNLLLLGLGVVILMRIKGKENQGLFEHLETQINDLSIRIEKKRMDVVIKKIDDLEERVWKIEGK